MTDSDILQSILLKQATSIAVVGHSDKPDRTSYRIAQEMRRLGYTIYPVNPTVPEIDGQTCYPTLADIPHPIDIVNVFRRSEYLNDIVKAAIGVGANAVWAQLGVQDEAAAQTAAAANMPLVMDTCIKVSYYRLVGKTR